MSPPPVVHVVELSLFERVTRERDEARAELPALRAAAQRVIDARENGTNCIAPDDIYLYAAIDQLTFALTDEPTEADQPDHIRSLVAASPSITAGLVGRVQHAVLQCHKALTDGSVTDEPAQAWFRTIVRSLLNIDEWGDDFDRWLDEWVESYLAALAVKP